MIPAPPAMFGLPGGYEWLAIIVIGLLILGRRFPGLARSLGSVGRSIAEIRKVLGR